MSERVRGGAPPGVGRERVRHGAAGSEDRAPSARVASGRPALNEAEMPAPSPLLPPVQ